MYTIWRLTLEGLGCARSGLLTCPLLPCALCFSFVCLAPCLNNCSDDACNKKQPNQTGDGINFASKIKGHELVFQHVVLLCWLSVYHANHWQVFICTLPPHPLISMLWRALFIHLRSLFREKADAAQGIKEENNIEIGGAGGNAKKEFTKINTAKRKATTNDYFVLLAE